MSTDNAARDRFIAHTFGVELASLEDGLGADFDRDAPSADLDMARFSIDLQDDEDDPNAQPRYYGHNVAKWAFIARSCLTCLDGTWPREPTVVDLLGIGDAVRAWIEAEDAWLKRRAAARRAATRAGRNWLGETRPHVR
jgi:hypothetical protein